MVYYISLLTSLDKLLYSKRKRKQNITPKKKQSNTYGQMNEV